MLESAFKYEVHLLAGILLERFRTYQLISGIGTMCKSILRIIKSLDMTTNSPEYYSVQ